MDLLTETRSLVESLVRGGSALATEQALAKYPELRSNRDALMELVYTEISVSEELGRDMTLEELVQRFPEYDRDLTRLMEVHNAMISEATFVGDVTSTAAGSATQHSSNDAEGANVDRYTSKQSDYELQGPIGHGGTSVVYKARQLSLQRDVAVKLVNHSFISHGPQRFQLEARAAAGLRHPNIVPIIDVFEVDGHSALAMEYMAGGSLAEAISDAALEFKSAAVLVSKLAQAIGYANDSGIIHRDLKPANVLLTKTGEPKITDFGLAKHIWNEDDNSQQLTQTGAALGSPCYMSPEQAAGNSEAICAATDVYGLGAILYEVLTRRPPFRGPNQIATLQMIQDQEAEPLRQHRPDTPRDLENICLKCLHKDPSRRYAAAYALAEDLNAFASGRPVVARPVGMPEKLAKFCRRHPLVAALSLAILLLSIISFITVVYFWNRAEREADAARSERNQANQSFAQAMQVVDKLTSLNQKFPASPESDKIREQTYREVKDFYEGFAKLRSGDPVVSSQMAQAHFRLSDLSMLLGHREAARRSAQIAVQRYRELLTADSDSRLYDQYGKALWQLATTQRGFNADGAVSNFNLAVEVYETLVARHPNNIDYKIALGNALSNRGSLFHNIRQPGKALDSIDQAVTLLESPSSQDRRAAFELSLALEVLGGIRMARGEHERAYDVAVRSLNLRKSFIDMDRVSDGHKYVARSLVELGKLSDRLGRTEVARQHYSEAINVQKRLVDQYPMRPRYAQLLNYFLYVSSNLESRQGDIVSATAKYENLLAVGYRSLGQSEMSIEDQLSFATQMLDAIDRLLALSKIASATDGLEQLFENLPQLADGSTHPQLLGRFMQTAAKAIHADLEYAEKDLRLSAILKEAQRESHAVQDPHPVLANALNATAAALQDLKTAAIQRPAAVQPRSD